MSQQYIRLLQFAVCRENQGGVVFCEQPPRQSAYRILIILYSSFESTSLPRSLLEGWVRYSSPRARLRGNEAGKLLNQLEEEQSGNVPVGGVAPDGKKRAG